MLLPGQSWLCREFPASLGLQCEILSQSKQNRCVAKLRTKAGEKSDMLSEGPEVGWDRYLVLRAKHSLNQQKQETLP